MSNWGAALGGFATGYASGYGTTSSAIDRWERRRAEDELRAALEGETGTLDLSNVNGDMSIELTMANTNLPTQESSETSTALPTAGDKASTEKPIDISKSAGSDRKRALDLSALTGGTQGRTFMVGNVPVEDRSTDYQRNRILPTDTGEKVVRESYTVNGVPVEDASTTYYANEMIRQSVENPAPKARATSEKPEASASATTERRGPTREKAAKLRKSKRTTAIPRVQAPTAAQTVRSAGGLIEGLTEGRPVGDIVASGAITPRAWRDAVDNPTSNEYPPASGTVPITQRSPDRYRAPLVGRDPTARPSLSDHPQVIRDTITGKMPERFAAEEQIARDRRAKEAATAERVQLDRRGGGPTLPVGVKPQPHGTSALAGGAQAAGQAPATGQAPQGEINLNPQGQGQASALTGGTQGSAQPAGQIRTQDGRTLNIGGGDLSRAIDLQAAAGQGNSYTDMNFRARQRQIMLAEAKYLLRVDPRAGIAAMKQLNQQDAQWELSDMYRGALSGDPQALGKIVQYMNIGQGDSEIVVSGDGTFAEYKTPNGTQRIQITPELIRQTLPTVQATFMLVNGMASDKAIELMQSMMTTGLQQDKLRSEIRENDATVRYLDAKARGASVAPKTDPYSSTDIDGNTYTIDKTTGGPMDLRTGQIYPRGVDPEAFKAWASENGAWASRFVVNPDRVGLISKDGTKFWDYQTGRVENIPQQGGASTNPNQPTANAANGSGDESLSIASGLIKDLEGFQASPYTDYTQTSIGYGTRANEGEKSITEAEASQRLEDHIRTEITPKLDSALANAGVNLNPRQKASLISLCYNVGTDTFLQSNAFEALSRGDLKRFVYEVADPEHGFTKVRTAMGGLQIHPGLVERRRKEMEPFLV